MSEKPRVTRFPIQWGDKDEPPQKILEDTPEQEQDNNNAGMGTMDDGRGMPQDDLEDGEGAADFGDEEEEDDDDLSIEGQNMMMDDDMMGNNEAYAVME